MKILGKTERNGDLVHPRITKALEIADAIHQDMTGRELEVPHVMDGKHKRGSRHYVGLAADLRIWYIRFPFHPEDFARELREDLGKHYDVILEKDHIHLEYDPKYPSL